MEQSNTMKPGLEPRPRDRRTYEWGTEEKGEGARGAEEWVSSPLASSSCFFFRPHVLW